MILFNGFLSAAVDSSGTGSSGFRDGLRSPAGIHLRGPAIRLILRRFQAVRGGLRPGVASQKIGPDASDMPRFAPQHTKCSGRNHKNNGLEASGESFSGQAVIICTEKTVSKHLAEKVFNGTSAGQMPFSQTRVSALSDTTGPLLDSELDSRVHRGIHPPISGALHARTTPVYRFHRARNGNRLALRCLSENSVTRRFSLTADPRFPRRTAASVWWELPAR